MKYYTDTQIDKFKKTVEQLYFYHDECAEYPFDAHGSGVYVKYKNTLFFLGCKHSFFGGNVAGPQIEFYSDLWFLRGTQLVRPLCDAIRMEIQNKDSLHTPEEDIMFYHFSTENSEYNDTMKRAAIIDSKKAIECIKEHDYNSYLCGFPTHYKGNVDYENKKVKSILLGRYVRLNNQKMNEAILKGLIDIQGLVESPSRDGQFSMNGLSGGGLMSCDALGSPYLVGMMTAGTVESKTGYFLSVKFIQHVLDSYFRADQNGEVHKRSQTF